MLQVFKFSYYFPGLHVEYGQVDLVRNDQRFI